MQGFLQWACLSEFFYGCFTSGIGRCEIKNGGCWKETKNNKIIFAYSNEVSKDCKCPPGFKGDGVKICEDINECKEKSVCPCKGYSCENTWGKL
ncbi:hypothetical protein GUJ93_ZPchr0010g8287 [Zizania palustris]|uniref:Complement Clr-like EGF domain-containing protein n=1 Tax=Zizania palustris TaxID=103762 RepID=A0A8J5W7H8_ZIZPA|nr:hypothetical protein GUJ93_ZPchr0010g8287 [Zizania palustris]